jgi:predicted kinase
MEAVIFIGIQATGKSTFYRERFFNTHVRINLDMLRTRHREELLVKACIAARQSFVIDNTNIQIRERAGYIALAKPAGFWIVGYYFQSKLEEAIQRNRQRLGNQNIPERGVIAKFRNLQIPHYSEGFDQLFTVVIDPENRSFTVKELQEGV